MDGVRVGIDLGTTYSLVAVLQSGQPVVLSNRLGEKLTPSAVSVDSIGTVLVGAPARSMATLEPPATAMGFKRDMGTDRVYRLGPKSFRAEELSALVLKELKQDAEEALGMPVAEAVVTVPAYFGELQRRATRDACEIAGLHVERIINEPTAAALSYGLHARDQELRAVVLDLGGGTFDVTVLEIIEGVIEIQASAGDSRLGGDDFVDALAELLAAQAHATHGADIHRNSTDWARLWEASERLKRQLTSDQQAELCLPEIRASGRDFKALTLTATRGAAEAAWRELLQRIERPIRRALSDAGARPQQIDLILLVGGATRMPCISALATRLFGKMPLTVPWPDHAVAMGAAIQAALKAGDQAVEDMVVTDVAPFTLGIETAEDVAQRIVSGLFTPILERGTVLPASRSKTFQTMVDNQREIMVSVYQGEHSLCKDNTKLGELRVQGLPKGPAGTQEVDVRFTYDLNGLLEVETTTVSTGKKAELLIERSPGRMQKKDIQQARANMARLKFHPRDALPNLTALNRADALFIELTGMPREILGAHIKRFRAVLETQDPALIREQREELVQLLEQLKL